VRERHIFNQAVVAVEPGIVHKDVDAPAEELGCPCDRFFNAILIANVRPEDFASAIKSSDLPRRRTCVLEIQNGDVRAFGGEGPSDVATEPSGCAGDQHILLRKAHRRRSFRHRL
jgi:hypothetical protein